jgi:phospholipase/carboxylesterase
MSESIGIPPDVSLTPSGSKEIGRCLTRGGSAMLAVMRSRLVLVALAGMGATFAVSCSNCRWQSSRTQPEVITVRWPATSPVGRGQELSRDRRAADAPEAPLPATEVAPGVRVREGVAHDLSYFEIILGDADFDDALPLVVLLHGRGDRPRIPGGPFRGVPTPMRLVIPRGPIRLGAGFAWVLSSVTQGKPDLLASSLRRRAHHLAALIETLSRTLPTLGRPVVAGFSQGAVLAFSLALHRPDVVGRAFPIAGWVPPELMPMFPVAQELRVPIRAVHGTDDPVIPIAPTREVVAVLRMLEWEVEFLEFEGVGHVVSPEMNATFEAWLEQALREQAPALTGKGLGLAGPEEETYQPWEPLEQETIEAIEQLEAQATPSATENEAPQDDTEDDAMENETERNGASDDEVDSSPENSSPESN